MTHEEAKACITDWLSKAKAIGVPSDRAAYMVSTDGERYHILFDQDGEILDTAPTAAAYHEKKTRFLVKGYPDWDEDAKGW